MNQSDESGALRIGTSRARADAGFTLIELLVAIGLLSLVSVILLSSLSLSMKVWERGAVHANRVEQVALVQNFLRRVIEDAYPLFTADASTQSHVEFEGTADSLRMLSSTFHALASGGRSRLALAIAREHERQDLVVVAAPELANGSASTARRILLADVRSIELSYFGRTRSDRQATWRDQWTHEMRLPQLVRVRVSFPPGDTRVWPELLVTPRIGADVGCVYDPLTNRCRGR